MITATQPPKAAITTLTAEQGREVNVAVQVVFEAMFYKRGRFVRGSTITTSSFLL